MTASSKILQRLSEQSNLACHDFNIGANDAAVSARLRELFKQGKVTWIRRKGEAYKRWSLSKPPEDKRWEFQGDGQGVFI